MQSWVSEQNLDLELDYFRLNYNKMIQVSDFLNIHHCVNFWKNEKDRWPSQANDV